MYSSVWIEKGWGMNVILHKKVDACTILVKDGDSTFALYFRDVDEAAAFADAIKANIQLAEMEINEGCE